MADPIPPPPLTTAPVLSTPETHILELPVPATPPKPTLLDNDLYERYEIVRTVREIREGGWRRIALQFPDGMLVDAPRVFEALQTESRKAPKKEGLVEGVAEMKIVDEGKSEEQEVERKFFILGDTSYGACCVDEVAAEHVDADVVVHYGRACLSP